MNDGGGGGLVEPWKLFFAIQLLCACFVLFCFGEAVDELVWAGMGWAEWGYGVTDVAMLRWFREEEAETWLERANAGGEEETR